MSDTIQVVSWALQQECVLRKGDAVAGIQEAQRAVGTASRTYGSALARGRDRRYGFGVYGDVCHDGLDAELLRRCRETGLNVIGIGHHSRREEREKSHFGKQFPDLLKDAEDVLAGWRAEGCDESFWAMIGVADRALDAWLKSREDAGGGA